MKCGDAGRARVQPVRMRIETPEVEENLHSMCPQEEDGGTGAGAPGEEAGRAREG